MRARTISRCQSLAIHLLVVGLLVGLCNAAMAADISRDVREGREDETIASGGYFEFSISALHNGLPVVEAENWGLHFSIGGHYRYKRFFIDALAESYNQFQFGLNAWSGQIWSVDVLGAISDHGVDSEFNDELRSYTDRDSGMNMGVRATAYNGPYIVQFESMADVTDTHGGYLFTASFARQWLVRNWNLHALIGARYQSARALDYQFGIDPHEASAQFAAYQAGSGTTLVSEIGLTYPINEFLVFKGTGRWWELPDSVASSPFITGDSYPSVTATLTLVY